jgi:hypothetical protein
LESGVSVPSLFRWARSVEGKTRDAAKAPAFLPLRPVVAEERSGFEIEVVLCNGRTIRARGDVDGCQLAALVGALEGAGR